MTDATLGARGIDGGATISRVSDLPAARVAPEKTETSAVPPRGSPPRRALEKAMEGPIGEVMGRAGEES
jgi:hypothetical protein